MNMKLFGRPGWSLGQSPNRKEDRHPRNNAAVEKHSLLGKARKKGKDKTCRHFAVLSGLPSRAKPEKKEQKCLLNTMGIASMALWPAPDDLDPFFALPENIFEGHFRTFLDKEV